MSTTLALLRALCLAALAAATFTLAWPLAATHARALCRLGVRGAKRQRALATEPSWALAESTVRWLATRIAAYVPPALRVRLDDLLTHAGDPLGLEPEELVILSAAAAVAGAVVGAAYAQATARTLLFALLGALLVGPLPLARIDSIRGRRAKRVQRGLPAVVDLLCLGLSAGLDFPSAVRQAVAKSQQEGDALTDELRVILSELQLGKSRKEALQLFAQRNPYKTVKEFVCAIVQSDEEGNPLADVLRIQSEVSRQHRSVRAEELASHAALQLLAPLALVFLAILILILGPVGLRVMEDIRRA